MSYDWTGAAAVTNVCIHNETCWYDMFIVNCLVTVGDVDREAGRNAAVVGQVEAPLGPPAIALGRADITLSRGLLGSTPE